jgi:tetratricopeptide (TPR) repeat protein
MKFLSFSSSLSSIKLESYDDSLQIFDKILSIDANNAGALYNKGVVLDIERKDLEAKEYQDKALEIDPNYSGEFFNRVSTITQVARNDAE